MMAWLQIALTLAIAFTISVPIGHYLAAVFMDRKTGFDRVFDPIDAVIYRLIGRTAVSKPMDWQTYTAHMLAANLAMAVLIYLILVFQDHLPLNPAALPGMEPMLAFNTAISFITNTDWCAWILRDSDQSPQHASKVINDVPLWTLKNRRRARLLSRTRPHHVGCFG